MEITELIKHPEQMDRESLYELRSLLALYPYFQTARLLMLHNLYLLHDPTFDEELRRASAYITDRRVLFQMIEGRHYEYHPVAKPAAKPAAPAADRTISLIDNFLDSIPDESTAEATKPKRKPTPADAAVDYVAYLMDIEEPDGGQEMPGELPRMFGQDLIDTFINDDKGKFQLSETPEYHPESQPEAAKEENEAESEYFTETLARIYIKQGRYSKALEIIQRLSLQIPKKNAYFADQIRFLEKLIVNSNKKNK